MPTQATAHATVFVLAVVSSPRFFLTLHLVIPNSRACGVAVHSTKLVHPSVLPLLVRGRPPRRSTRVRSRSLTGSPRAARRGARGTRAAHQSHVVQAVLVLRLVSQSVKWKTDTTNTFCHDTKRFIRSKKKIHRRAPELKLNQVSAHGQIPTNNLAKKTTAQTSSPCLHTTSTIHQARVVFRHRCTAQATMVMAFHDGSATHGVASALKCPTDQQNEETGAQYKEELAARTEWDTCARTFDACVSNVMKTQNDETEWVRWVA